MLFDFGALFNCGANAQGTAFSWILGLSRWKITIRGKKILGFFFPRL
jgi:hypothetical protein